MHVLSIRRFPDPLLKRPTRLVERVDGRVRRQLNLSSAERAALVAFLKTLSDPTFLKDPKFSNPFVQVASN